MYKSKLILMLMTLVLTLFLAIYITFAWFDMIKNTKPILIQTGSLKLTSAFYIGNDTDGSGTIEDNEYIEINEGMFSLNNVIPGKSYNFRISSVNEGTMKGHLSLIMNDINISNKEILKGYNIKYTDPISSDNITKTLYNSTGESKYKLLIFDNYVLVPNSVYNFDFTIEVKDDYQSNWGGETLTISHYIISLVQMEW